MFLYCWELAFGWPCNKIIENSRWSANQICQILSVEKDQGVCFYGFWRVKSINELFWQRNYARSIQRSTLARYSINEDVQFISIFQIKIFRRVLWFGYCFYSNGLDFDIRSRVIWEAFIWGSIYVIWENCRKIEFKKFDIGRFYKNSIWTFQPLLSISDQSFKVFSFILREIVWVLGEWRGTYKFNKFSAKSTEKFHDNKKDLHNLISGEESTRIMQAANQIL